jgi:hypothetical protein
MEVQVNCMQFKVVPCWTQNGAFLCVWHIKRDGPSKK